MEARLQEPNNSSPNIARFIENAKRYTEIPELTSEILRIFIKLVEVGERAEKYSRTAPQEVRIYYCDIGSVDELPQSMVEAMTEKVPDEVARTKKGGCAETQPPSTGTNINLLG